MDVDIARRIITTLPADDDHPYRTGAWRPQSTEWTEDSLQVIEGEIPADLDGVYIRNTENPVHPAIGHYHPFDGDAMLHVVGFKDGRAFYRNRFVRTAGFLAEQQARGPLWTGIIEPPSESIATTGWGARGRLKDSSSTDVVVHAGVALSSFYQCGDLYRIDPLTLETLGPSSWGGDFPAEWGVSAHAKVDVATGELLFFTYSTQAPYLRYGVVDATNHLVHLTDVPLPGPRLPHDMAFTANFAILNDCPLYWDEALMADGYFMPRLHRDMPMRLGVMPRRGAGSEIRWFDCDNTYVLHWTNAYEEGDEVVVEGFFQGDPMPRDNGEGSDWQRAFRYLAMDRIKSRLRRWRLNMRTGVATESDVTDQLSEFGVVPAAHYGSRARYTYAALGTPGWFMFDGIVRHDLEDGSDHQWVFGEHEYGSEVAVVPRGGTDRAEDDAWVITVTSDTDRDLSECLIFDASRIADGPVARLRLPERVSSGTHATWADGSEVAGWGSDRHPFGS